MYFLKTQRERERRREGGTEWIRMCWHNVMSLRLLYYFSYFTFGIIEPLINSLPPQKPLAEKDFMFSLLVFFLLTALEKLLIYWANIKNLPCARLSFRCWDAVKPADKILVLMRETVLKLKYTKAKLFQTISWGKGRAKGGKFLSEDKMNWNSSLRKHLWAIFSQVVEVSSW